MDSGEKIFDSHWHYSPWEYQLICPFDFAAQIIPSSRIFIQLFSLNHWLPIWDILKLDQSSEPWRWTKESTENEAWIYQSNFGLFTLKVLTEISRVDYQFSTSLYSDFGSESDGA